MANTVFTTQPQAKKQVAAVVAPVVNCRTSYHMDWAKRSLNLSIFGLIPSPGR